MTTKSEEQPQLLLNPKPENNEAVRVFPAPPTSFTPAGNEIPSYLMQPVHRSKYAYIMSDPDKGQFCIKRTLIGSARDSYANFRFQPAFNGSRMLYHTKTQNLYTGYGSKLIKKDNDLYNAWVEEIQNCVGDNDLWLEVIPVYSEYPKGYTGQLMILDLIKDNIPARARRLILEDYFFPIGVRQVPLRGEVNLVPEYTEEVSDNLYMGLARMNIDWGHIIYGGIVTVNQLSSYLVQTMYRHTTCSSKEFFPLDGLDGFFANTSD